MNWKTYDFRGQGAGPKGEVLDRGIYSCAFCKGKKIISSQGNRKCPVCSAIGTVEVSPLAVVCAYCNGAGRSFLNRSLTCSVCKGKGVVSVTSREVDICPSCKGKGREKNGDCPCLTCRGKGVIVKEAKEEGNQQNGLLS